VLVHPGAIGRAPRPAPEASHARHKEDRERHDDRLGARAQIHVCDQVVRELPDREHVDASKNSSSAETSRSAPGARDGAIRIAAILRPGHRDAAKSQPTLLAGRRSVRHAQDDLALAVAALDAAVCDGC
jgi:hypothetical protein